MQSSRRQAFISTPNPDRLRGDDRLFAQAVVHAAGLTGPLRVPEGWRHFIAITQPVKQICVSQSRRFQA
jgi:hypothetical protein